MHNFFLVTNSVVHWKITWKKNAAFPPVPENYIDIPTIETWRELEKLVDEGFIRNIGVSNFTSCDIEKFWHQARIKPAVNQVEMHPLLQQAKLREYCAIRGIHMTAYSSLGNNERYLAIICFLKEFSPFRGQFPNILENPTICRLAGKHKKSPGSNNNRKRFFLMKISPNITSLGITAESYNYTKIH